jgi:hypothetical protein
MAYNPLEVLSQNIATLGQVFGLPEMKISERIYQPATGTQTVPYVYGSTGGAYVDPNYSSSPWVSTSPTPGPTPSPTPQPTGSDTRLQQLAKMDRNPPQEAEYQQLLQQQGPSVDDINAIYAPAAQTLNEQEALLRSQLPGAQQSIEQQYGLASQEMEANRRAQEAALARQETNVGTAKSNALSEARKLYNELAQNYAARFGSRTSAGPFAMELLGRETARQMSAAELNAQNSLTAIGDERNRVLDLINTQKEKFALAKNDALRELNVTFQNKLAEINSARNALETEKAARRLSALQEAQARAYQIKSAEQEFNQKVQLFQLQQEYSLANKAAAATGYDTKYVDLVNKIGGILQAYGPSAAQTVASKVGVDSSMFAPSAGYEWYFDTETGKYTQRKIGS